MPQLIQPIMYFSDNVTNRWYKAGDRFIQLTPQGLSKDKIRVYKYEYVENSKLYTSLIDGFYLYSYMEPSTQSEYEEALKKCINTIH